MRIQALEFIYELESLLGDSFSTKEFTDLPVTLDLNKYKTLKERFRNLEAADQASVLITLLSQEDVSIFLISIASTEASRYLIKDEDFCKLVAKYAKKQISVEKYYSALSIICNGDHVKNSNPYDYAINSQRLRDLRTTINFVLQQNNLPIVEWKD